MHSDTITEVLEMAEYRDRWLDLDPTEHAALMALRASYESVLDEIDGFVLD